MKKILEVKNLSKSYYNFTAVNDVSFDVFEGEIFGILGPNGAGKTTTLEIIEGLRNQSSGIAKIDNIEVSLNNREKIQNLIGVQLQSSSYFDLLTIKEILDLFGSFYKKRIDSIELLELVGLTDKKNSLVKNLSGGQAQRFSIVAAMVNNPDLIFLDEPTTGLDPNIRRSLWDLIKKINGQNKTIILTTHYMEEAEILCDRVAIMNRGKIIACDTPANLINKLDLKFTIKFIPQNKLSDLQIKKIKDNKKVLSLSNEKNKFIIQIKDSKNINDILNFLEENNIILNNLEIVPPNLENVFLTMTGKKLKEVES